MTTFRPGDRVHLKGHAHTPATTGTVITETLTAVYVMWDDNYATSKHHPQHLEPAGEPMSKKPNQFTNESGSKFMIASDLCGHIGLGVETGGNAEVMRLPATDAPALALAILESAGITDKGFAESSDAEMAVAHLASHVGLERANAKAVADQKVLEAEAFTLYSAAPFTSGVQSFELLSDGAKVQWLSIARAARDLHGVTK